MTTLLYILTLILGLGLLIVAAMRPQRAATSRFELNRRAETGDSHARHILHRESLLGDVLSLQRIVVALLLVIVAVLCVSVFGWLTGLIVAVIIALEYGSIARLNFLKSWAQKLYSRVESKLLQTIEHYPKFFAVIRSVTPDNADDYQLESREQLLHLVAGADAILSADEKRTIKHSLEFSNLTVSSIMTPSGVIDSISRRELLGPLVLDDLHRTGHSRFPVVDGDINHVVGMLHIRDLLTVDAGKHSTTAEKSMEPRAFYIHQDQTLQHALAAFLRTHHHLFVVVNEFRETVGLLSLEDVIEALLGRKIIDEFDAHEDLRAVAARNPRDNNNSPKHTDV